MPYRDYDPEDITLEMQLEHIDRLPIIEAQDLQRFKEVSNPSYHLTSLKKSLLERDKYLQALQWINKNLHRLQNWGQKVSTIATARDRQR